MKSPQDLLRKSALVIAPPVLAVLAALAVGAIIILFTGENPLSAYGALFVGAFGSIQALADTLEKATPYLFGGLAFLLAARAGLFNIGVEGQMYAGAIVAAILGFVLHGLPPVVHVLIVLAGAALAGGAFAALPAVLKVRRNVHEVISTMMLNYIAYAMTAYLTVHVFADAGAVAQTPPVLPSAVLTALLPPSRLNSGFLIAVVLAVLLWVFLFKTPGGFDLRVIGLNRTAAEYAGVNGRRVVELAFLGSGVVAGLMGAERVLGVYGRFINAFSPGYGFTAIAVSLLAANNPLGVIPAAILFGALENGGSAMSLMMNVPRELGLILEALIIVFIAGENFFRHELQRMAARRAS